MGILRKIQSLGALEYLNWMPDKMYLKLVYRARVGKKLKLNNPETFNEKLQWLKIYDRKPEYTGMVDKYEVKKYVAERIGEKYIIPILGVWDCFDDIDFHYLPNQFVLKCTHDSGGLIIVRDKCTFDMTAAKTRIEKCLKSNYFWSSREWPYKNVKPRIIAEAYMSDGEHMALPVYKLMCFSGEPKIIQTIQNDKQPNSTIDYFDINWNLLQIRQNYPNSKNPYKKPAKLTEMLKLARILSKGKAFIRIDFYIVDNQIFFSEYTFYSDTGMERFIPDLWDDKLGQLIILPETN